MISMFVSPCGNENQFNQQTSQFPNLFENMNNSTNHIKSVNYISMQCYLHAKRRILTNSFVYESNISFRKLYERFQEILNTH